MMMMMMMMMTKDDERASDGAGDLFVVEHGLAEDVAGRRRRAVVRYDLRLSLHAERGQGEQDQEADMRQRVSDKLGRRTSHRVTDLYQQTQPRALPDRQTGTGCYIYGSDSPHRRCRSADRSVVFARWCSLHSHLMRVSLGPREFALPKRQWRFRRGAHLLAVRFWNWLGTANKLES